MNPRFYTYHPGVRLNSSRVRRPRDRRKKRPRSLPKRRPDRIRYSRRQPGEYTLWCWQKIWIPTALAVKVRQLAMLDDRTLGELTTLGLTWVVTEWAAQRLPAGVSLDDVKLAGGNTFYRVTNRRPKKRTAAAAG